MQPLLSPVSLRIFLISLGESAPLAREGQGSMQNPPGFDFGQVFD
jgi:hypothetical protein